MITVKVGKLPGSVNEYALEDGASVQTALDVAELSAEGFTLTVNSTVATSGQRLATGDVVMLTKNIKGN